MMTEGEGVLKRLFALDGRVAVVAGEPAASACASARPGGGGRKLRALDLDYDAASALASRLAARGAEAIAVRADATQQTELESALSQITDRLGPPDDSGERDPISRPRLLQFRSMRLPEGSLGKRDGRQFDRRPA